MNAAFPWREMNQRPQLDSKITYSNCKSVRPRMNTPKMTITKTTSRSQKLLKVSKL